MVLEEIWWDQEGEYDGDLRSFRKRAYHVEPLEHLLWRLGSAQGYRGFQVPVHRVEIPLQHWIDWIELLRMDRPLQERPQPLKTFHGDTWMVELRNYIWRDKSVHPT